MRILLSGGGTAGHINPAIAIAKYAISQDSSCEVLFVGTKKGLERTLVPKEGFDIKFVNVEGLKKELSLRSAVSCAKLAMAVARSMLIIKKFKPDVVVGTGGYVCVSSVIAAKLLGIPSVVHEQNVFPGSAVKFLADKCNVTAISFEESKKYIKKGNCNLTGNPVRPAILNHTADECKKKLGLCGKKAVLIFGGSLGAERINDVTTELLKSKPKLEDTVIYFGTGKRDYDRVKENLGSVLPSENIIVTPYIDNMDILMNAADVVVCRSGAITLAEICAVGKSSVLIPSPNVTNNHQEYNARALSDKGAAITITENEFNVESLREALFGLLDDEARRNKMAQKAKSLGITDAVEKIYDIIKSLL